MRQNLTSRIGYIINKEYIKPSYQSGYSRLYDHYLKTIQEDLMLMRFDYPGLNYEPQPYIKKKVTYVPRYLKKGKMRTKLETMRNNDLAISSIIDHYSVPRIHRISLNLLDLNADNDKMLLLNNFLIIEALGGVIGETIYSTGEGETKTVRSGKPVGCKATLIGEKMYSFIDKLVEHVMPRSKKNKAGLVIEELNRPGKFKFEIPYFDLGFFPDIEIIYDVIPNVSNVSVIVETTAGSKEDLLLLLQGFQIPVDTTPIPVKEEERENRYRKEE